MVLLLKLHRWLVYPFSKKAWRIMMLITALTIFATCMGIFAPTLVSLYLQWAKETNTPVWIRSHPYSAPAVGAILILVLALAFLIYASIREYRIQKSKKQKQIDLENELKAVISRLDALDKLCK